MIFVEVCLTWMGLSLLVILWLILTDRPWRSGPELPTPNTPAPRPTGPTSAAGPAPAARTKNPYPTLIRGKSRSETRRARLLVQRNPEAYAIYRAVTANPADDVPRGALADWLEERGFPGAADNLRKCVK